MKAEVSIRRARQGDEEALALVGQACFLQTYSGVLDGAAILKHCQRAHSPAQYRQWLHDPDSAIWLVEGLPGNAPVGYLVVTTPDLSLAQARGDRELKRLYLLARFQGSGFGTQLLELAVEYARSTGAAQLLLGVYAGNDSSLQFYRRHGFVHLTERKFDVGGCDYDDRVMCLTLGG